jgi:hypothetical protein
MKDRLLLVSICLLMLSTLVGCGGSDEDDSPAKPAPAPRTLAPKEATPTASPDEIALKSGLSLIITPILRGRPSSERYSLDLKSWQLGPASIEFSGPMQMAGTVTIPEQARVSGKGFAAPFFWGAGSDKVASGPLIWLSSETFRELQSTGRTTIVPTSLPGSAIASGTSTQPIGLRKSGTEMHTVSMLGRSVSVPVLVAEDDSGTRYAILDTPANPLVVSVRYGPKSMVGGSALPGALTAGSGYDVVAIELPKQPTNTRPSEPLGRPSPGGSPRNGAK